MWRVHARRVYRRRNRAGNVFEKTLRFAPFAVRDKRPASAFRRGLVGQQIITRIASEYCSHTLQFILTYSKPKRSLVHNHPCARCSGLNRPCSTVAGSPRSLRLYRRSGSRRRKCARVAQRICILGGLADSVGQATAMAPTQSGGTMADNCLGIGRLRGRRQMCAWSYCDPLCANKNTMRWCVYGCLSVSSQFVYAWMSESMQVIPGGTGRNPPKAVTSWTS